MDKGVIDSGGSMNQTTPVLSVSLTVAVTAVWLRKSLWRVVELLQQLHSNGRWKTCRLSVKRNVQIRVGVQGDYDRRASAEVSSHYLKLPLCYLER